VVGVPLGDRGVDFVGLPKAAAFHAAGDDEGLTGDVTREGVGGEEDGGVGDVVRASDLREGHGGGDFFDHVGIAELGFVSGDDGPTGANAIESAAAVIACVRREAGDFVLQRSSQAIGDGGFPRRIVCMTGFTENSSGRRNENGIALLLFCDNAEEFADGQKSGRQNTIESLAPLAERHLIDRNVCGDPGTGIGDESVYASEPFDCSGEHAFDLPFFAEISLDDERVRLIKFATKGSNLGATTTVMENKFCAFRGKLSSDGGADAA